MIERLMDSETPAPTAIFESLKGDGGPHQAEVDHRRLEADYVRYARIASGQEPPNGPAWQGCHRRSVWSWNVTFMPIFPMKSSIGEEK